MKDDFLRLGLSTVSASLELTAVSFKRALKHELGSSAAKVFLLHHLLLLSFIEQLNQK